MAIIPVKDLTTEDILYGDRNTQYRWEVLEHSNGVDYLVGTLDGVSDGSLSWVQNAAVKGRGKMEVLDLEAAQPGMLRIGELPLESCRIRPVMTINGADKKGSYEEVWLTDTNLLVNPAYRATDGAVEVRRNKMPYPGDEPTGTAGWTVYRTAITNPGGFIRGTVNTSPAPGGACGIVGSVAASAMGVAAPGDTWTIVADLRASGVGRRVSLAIQYYDNTLTFITGSQTLGTEIEGDPVVWNEASVTATAPAGTAYFRVLALRRDNSSIGEYIDMRRATADLSAVRVGPPFSGNYSYDSDLIPSWAGTSGSSESILSGARVANVPNHSAVTLPPYQITTPEGAAARHTLLSTVAIAISLGNASTSSGREYTALFRARASRPTQVRTRINGVSSADYTLTTEWQEIRVTILGGSPSVLSTGLYVYADNSRPAGTTIDIDDGLLAEGTYSGEAFDGSTPNTVPYRRYAWLGVADASPSTQELRVQQWVSSDESIIPEIPWGTFLLEQASEEWEDTGRVWKLSLLDRTTVPSQDVVDQSYAVAAGTNILQEVRAILATSGEYMSVDESIDLATRSGMVWEAGTSKLNIINDLLDAAGYNSLWMDGWGNFQATPRVLPADRSIMYELLALPRELLDGERAIYQPDWSRERDSFGVPNKVIAVQAAGGEDEQALVGQWTNEDPASPYSYISRGRWVPHVLDSVECPEGTEAEILAFLEARARATLVQMSAVQAEVKITHLPIPVRVSDVLRFANTRAGVDARHVITRLDLETSPTGLMKSTLQEVISL